MMKCHEAQALMDAYADGEIDRLKRHSVENHLRDCAQCARQHEEILGLRARLRAEVPYYAAPPGLASRIRAAAQHGQDAPSGRPQARRERWRWLGMGALTGCAATVLAWLVGTATLMWIEGQDVIADAVQTHVRASLNSRVVEVASSDLHNVKPWLSARLDYSPPVPDLRGEGFLLMGGRVDMLAQRPVAVLVYRYGNHSIDVFVRPQPVPDLARVHPVRGFNVSHASGGGWDWLAVSDVSPDVLARLAELLADAGGGRR